MPALSCELHFWAQLGSTAFPETGRLGFLERDLARRPTCRAGINVSAWGNKCLFSISVFSKSRFGTKAVTGSCRTAERGYRVSLGSFAGEVVRSYGVAFGGLSVVPDRVALAGSPRVAVSGAGMSGSGLIYSYLYHMQRRSSTYWISRPVRLIIISLRLGRYSRWPHAISGIPKQRNNDHHQHQALLN